MQKSFQKRKRKQYGDMNYYERCKKLKLLLNFRKSEETKKKTFVAMYLETISHSLKKNSNHIYK